MMRRTPRLMGEIVAKQIAAECPLIWTQVRSLAWFAALEDGRAEFEQWLLWGPHHEVAEWLWEYWVEHGSELAANLAEDQQEISSVLGSLPRPSFGRPATARDAGQRQPRAVSIPVSVR